MKTRTLLLLSVGTALAILLVGGVLLFQLSNEQSTVDTIEVGREVQIGDVTVTVDDVANEGSEVLGVAVEIGGVDDPDGLDSFRLVTGDRSLTPMTAPADGRCVEITADAVSCRLDFDVSGTETSSRVLVMRRGDDQANWRLPSG